MTKSKVTTALIVGLGSIGKRHLRLLKEINPQLKIIALTRKALKKSNNNIDNYVSNIKEAISFNPEIAIISNPSSLHLKYSIPLVESGTHLLIEKPISASSKNVDKLIDLAKRKKIKLTVGYNLRFLKSLNFFRKRILDKTIGKIYSVRSEVGQHLRDWRPNSDYRQGVSAQRKLGGGVLLELSHEIDYLTWIFGSVKSVTGYINKLSDLEIDVEDLAHCFLSFKGIPSGQEVQATLNMDFIRKDPIRQCTVIGEKGTLNWDGIKNKVTIFNDKEGWKLIYGQEEDIDLSYRAQLIHFLDCVENDKEPMITGISAMETLKVIEAIKKSSKKKKFIEIDHLI